jgi:hypothetical protein
MRSLEDSNPKQESTLAQLPRIWQNKAKGIRKQNEKINLISIRKFSILNI